MQKPYILVNIDTVVSEYGQDYCDAHVVRTLDGYFADLEKGKAYAVEMYENTFLVNDVADNNRMLHFQFCDVTANGVTCLRFIEAMKG